MDKCIDLAEEFGDEWNDGDPELSAFEGRSILETFRWSQDYLRQAGLAWTVGYPGDPSWVAAHGYIQSTVRRYLLLDKVAWRLDYRFPRFTAKELVSIDPIDRKFHQSGNLAPAPQAVVNQKDLESTASANSAVQYVLESVPAAVRAGFVEAVSSAISPSGELDETLWGERPSASKVRTAALQALKEEFVARQELLHASLSVSELSGLFGTTDEAIIGLVASGELIALSSDGDWRIPMWQISGGAGNGFLPGIAELRRAFPGGVVSLSRWAVTPNVELENSTPADALLSGQVAAVVALAIKTTAAAWQPS